MSQIKSKILGLIIFLTVVSVVLFISLKGIDGQKEKIVKSINLSGNHLLPQVSYLNFARLSEASNFTPITLPILKARIEKHPFVQSAKVELSEFNSAKVYLLEKNPEAILIINNQTYLLSDELQLLPMYSNTKFVDLPIINNPKHESNYKVLDFLQSTEIIEAHNILYAIKNLNDDMLKYLSEINLNSGEDITLTFSGIRPIIKFGRSEIAKKVLNLDSIWSELKNENGELSQSDYVDLRLTNQIYFSKTEQSEKEL